MTEESWDELCAHAATASRPFRRHGVAVCPQPPRRHDSSAYSSCDRNKTNSRLRIKTRTSIPTAYSDQANDSVALLICMCVYEWRQGQGMTD